VLFRQELIDDLKGLLRETTPTVVLTLAPSLHPIQRDAYREAHLFPPSSAITTRHASQAKPNKMKGQGLAQ
jgi:hypothetical protein